MKIETKYNLGDAVWFVDSKVRQQRISQVRIEQSIDDLGNPRDVSIAYRVYGEWRFEKELFPTKEELLKSL